MATLTIRNLDDSLKARLRMRATVHGRSMADEALDIITAALPPETALPGNLAAAIRAPMVFCSMRRF